MDDRSPEGQAWHSELLEQMTLELPTLRPPVLDRSTARQLDEYRRFRHRIRNVYASMLDPRLMQAIVETLSETSKALHQDLVAFCDFLEVSARAGEG